jgi:ketosteroid isomerase-like protein
MPKEIIRELVYRAYEAYELGHRDFIVDLLDDDIELIFNGPSEIFPVPNRVRGRAAVLAAYKTIDETMELLGNKLELVLVDGEHAAVIGERSLRLRASGRIINYKFAAFHLYSNGRLIKYQSFVDTIDMAQQVLGLKMELPAYPR